MQAVPTANALPQVIPPSGSASNVATLSTGQPSDAGLASGAGTGDAMSFEQVLAAQIDVSQLRPDLLLVAANADVEETPVDEQGLLFGKDANQPLVFPTLNLADPAADSLSDPDAQTLGAVSAAVAGRGTHQESGIGVRDLKSVDAGAELADAQLQKQSGIHGLEALDVEGGERAGEGLQSAGGVNGTHGPAEVQRASTTRAADPTFNPRQIPEQVQSPRWGEALGQRVVWMAKENVQVVYLQVEPPNLGPLEVQLRLTNDQANVTFSSAHAAVREAISGSLETLDELLAAGGVSLGSVSVNTQAPSQDSGQPSGQSSMGGSGWQTDDSASGAASVPARVALGLVDTFA